MFSADSQDFKTTSFDDLDEFLESDSNDTRTDQVEVKVPKNVKLESTNKSLSHISSMSVKTNKRTFLKDWSIRIKDKRID
jgi:hypothetical protein